MSLRRHFDILQVFQVPIWSVMSGGRGDQFAAVASAEHCNTPEDALAPAAALGPGRGLAVRPARHQQRGSPLPGGGGPQHPGGGGQCV